MDPEGVREVYYAECGAASDYGVHSALRTLPFLVRWDDSQFVGVHLPLTRRLPKRIDKGLQQSVGLHRYDAVVLAGIDPIVFDSDDLMNLAAYVERGGGLLLFGGEHAFANAQRNWGPLREALPAEIAVGPEGKAGEPVSLVEPHPIVRGLSGPLGSVSVVQPIEPKKHGAVLAAANGKPLIVAGTYHHGRVLIIASYPDATPDSMFASPGYADLLRQALTWLMNRPEDLAIEHCELDASAILVGDERTLSVRVRSDARGQVRARASISRADPGWLATGREPQFGNAQVLAAEVSRNTVACRFAPAAPGLWQVQLDVEGEGWANRRFALIPVHSPLQLRLSSRTGKYVFAPGWTLPLELAADDAVRATLRILDCDGKEALRQEGVGTGHIDVKLPQLELGHYEAVAEAEGEEARLRFSVAQQLQRIPFSIVATSAPGPFTEEKVKWIYEYFRERGFSGYSVSIPTEHNKERPEASIRAGRYLEYLAQSDGFDLWGEYAGTCLLQQRTYRGEEGTDTTKPCVYDPQYKIRVRELLSATFRAASLMPRLTSLEILDEPHMYRANVCHCEFCQAEFRRRYGYDLPTWDEAIAAKDRRTREYFEFVIDYATQAFRTGYETWKSLGAWPLLHHVLCGVGSGHHSANASASEDLPWSPYADFVEFDCYNYMYPHWRPKGQLRWNEFHYLFAHFRFQTLRNKQRLGFFIQVTDRDVPVAAWDALRAPSETLYAAIGQGAKSFHLMAKGPFTSSQNCREEKFNTFAEDIKKVQRVAPLLDRAERPRSRIAMTFPFHDRLYRVPPHRLPEGFIGWGFYGRQQRPFDTMWPYHTPPFNVAEMLFRAFGEVDVIDQRAFHEGALDCYPGFVLNTTDYVTREDAEAVVRFVGRGGLLVCDHIPSHDTDGRQLDLLGPVFGGQTEHFYKHVTLTRSTFGKGRTLLFSDDLNELYTGSVERDEPVLRYKLKETIRDFFFSRGIRPQALSSNYEVAAGVLLTPDTIVLVAVNHAETRQQSRVTLFSPAVPVTVAFNMVTMERYAFQKTERGIELALDLDEREGLILGLYAEAPVRSAIRLERERFRPGERLAFSVLLTDASGRAARGDQIVEVRVTDAKGEERRQFGGLRCASNGVLRIDEPLAVNARTGQWAITAFDRYTTRQVRASFTVA